MPGWFPRLVVLFLLSCTLGVSGPPAPEAWVPVRWTGGPLELAWRTRAKTLPADAAVRDALARWYEPATLSLLEDSSAFVSPFRATRNRSTLGVQFRFCLFQKEVP